MFDVVTSYRVDGGVQSFYTANKELAFAEYDNIIEEFGEPATIWELTEEYDEQEKEYNIIDENIIKTTNQLLGD